MKKYTKEHTGFCAVETPECQGLQESGPRSTPPHGAYIPIKPSPLGFTLHQKYDALTSSS
jgi:hypothetical protein